MPPSLGANPVLQSGLGSPTCSSELTWQQLQMLSHLLSTANNPAASVPASDFICKLTDVPTQKHPLQAAPHNIKAPLHLLNNSSCLYSRDVICYPIFRDYSGITLLYIILYPNIQKSRWLLVCAGSKSFSCIKGEEKSKLCLQWTPLTSLPPPGTVQFQCQHCCSSARLPKPA